MVRENPALLDREQRLSHRGMALACCLRRVALRATLGLRGCGEGRRREQQTPTGADTQPPHGTKFITRPRARTGTRTKLESNGCVGRGGNGHRLTTETGGASRIERKSTRL